MLISWAEISKYINKPINGLLHIGAHLAEELSIYNAANITGVIWVEANEDRANKIKEIVPSNHQVVCSIVGDENGREVYFNEANNGQSSSIFELGAHLIEHPEIYYTNRTKRTMNRIDFLREKYNFINFNFVALDIQGAELLAIKGMGELLNNVEYIYTEVNEKKLYEGCCLISDLDNYLIGFERVITNMTTHGWGDAFYVKKPIIEHNNNFFQVHYESEFNGEIDLAESFSKELTIFDVGSRSDSCFLSHEGEVHYFDPLDYNIDKLKIQKNKNKKSFYNKFGLSDKKEIIKYYPKYESFLNRTATLGVDNEDQSFELEVKKGDDYIKEYDIKEIDLLKINTEGYELKVLNGFDSSIDKIKFVQFAYGGTYIDAKIKLNDVCDFLRRKGFKFFYYILPEKLYPIINFEDHYNYSNIFCSRKELTAKSGGQVGKILFL